MDIESHIDSNILAVESRMEMLEHRFDDPAPFSFGAVYSTFDEPSLPLAPPPPESNGPVSEGDSLQGIIEKAASQNGVDPALLRAVIKQESGENPNAHSRAGAMGLMQLMPKTAQSLGVTDPYNPQQNVFGGARYLRGLLDQFGGNTSLALAAYNAGPNAVKEHGWKVPPYAETQHYVKNILQNYNDYRNEGNAVRSVMK